MAFSPEELKEVQEKTERFIKSLRDQGDKPEELDYGYRIKGQSVILYEIERALIVPRKQLEMEFAKATYVRSSGKWKIYWMLASGKWEMYFFDPEADDLDSFFEIVREDANMSFFG